MPIYRTCAGCLHASAPCIERRVLGERIAGLGITSLKFRCAWRAPAYRPGDLVYAKTSAYFQDDESGPAPKCWYPGVVIKSTSPRRFVVYIEPGAAPEEGSPHWLFEPGGSRPGYCKIPVSRMRRREGVPEPICPLCDAITRLQPHDSPCVLLAECSDLRTLTERGNRNDADL